jgi:hypothetical protein
MKVSVRDHRLFAAAVFTLSFLLFFTSNAMAGCRSYAYEKKDAIAFCQKKLKCKAPEIVVCYGQPREWKCRCEKPKEDAPKESEGKFESGHSIKKDTAMPPSKPMKEK